MAMTARRPDGLSWQNTTCSWPVSVLNTFMKAPCGACFVGRRGGADESDISLSPTEVPSHDLGVSCDDRAVPSLFASYLRVYEPLAAFDRDHQLFWRRYVKEGRAVAPSDGPGRQRTAVLEA